MAVNKKVYTDNIVYGCGNQNLTGVKAGCETILNQLRQMLIDHGVMAEWHDSWYTLSGSSHGYYRVLKVTLDANKTYGSYFILFNCCFYAPSQYSYFAMSMSCGDWNATSHVPVGTQYLDWLAAPCTDYGIFTSPPNARWIIRFDGSGAAAVREWRLVSYKSGSSIVFYWQGATNPFVLNFSLGQQPSWLDLNKVCVPTFFGTSGDCGTGPNQWRLISFWMPFSVRRFFSNGKSGCGTNGSYYTAGQYTSGYMYVGNNRASSADNASNTTNDPVSTGNYFNWGGALRMPWSDGASNSSIVQPWAPIVTNIDLLPPLNVKLPSDFGIMTLPSLTKTLTAQNRISISDTEVWEVIAPMASSGTPLNTMALMARVV